MDTQIGTTPETEGEWAVDRILSHANSGTDSVFEIMWKSGDVTWMPYYQITHLQALTDYLDLFRESKIKNLPKGTGKPPQDDPQIFLGAVSPFSPTIPISTSPVSQSLKSKLSTFAKTIVSFISTPFQHSLTFISPTVDIELSMPHQQRPLRSVNHPLFVRLSPTTYLMKDPCYPVHSTIHVGQLAEYMQFDKQLRAHGNSAGFHSIPIGFTDFCNTWNDGVASGDPRRISIVYIDDDSQNNRVTPSRHPVSLQEFYITPAQAGVATENTDEQSSVLQAEIAQEFAAIMVAKQKKERKFYEERREKRIQAFGAPTAIFSKIKHVHRRSRKQIKPRSPTPTTSKSPPKVYAPKPEDQSSVPEDHQLPEVPDDETPPSESNHVPVPMEDVHN